jgi:4-hydroxy-4-methyl-2-oxoglutarate aldolase
MSHYTSDQLELARKLGSATLHEAAGRIGALPSAIKPVHSAMRLAGPAFTVHVPAGDNLWIHRALYAAQPGEVLLVHVSGGVEWGYWGDILNTAALSRGLAGLVIDGGVRDSTNLAEMELPVFSNGICIRGTIKDYDGTAWMQKPVQIGSVIVRNGDLVVGDADGVVVLPRDAVLNALVKGVEREADEAAKIERIKAGERTIDIYGFGEV